MPSELKNKENRIQHIKFIRGAIAILRSRNAIRFKGSLFNVSDIAINKDISEYFDGKTLYLPIEIFKKIVAIAKSMEDYANYSDRNELIGKMR